MQSNRQEGILKFAKPDQVLCQLASATITSYLGEVDASGNEIGVAHGSVLTEPTYLAAINYPVAHLFLLAISAVSFKKSLTAKHIYLNLKEGLNEKLMLTNLQASKMERMAEIYWYQKNAYCIQIEDEGDEQTRYAMMLKHLNKYFHEKFGINAWLEPKQIKCFVLIRTSQERNPFSKQIVATEDDYIGISGGKMPDLVYLLNSHKDNFLDYPIVDETDFTGSVTVNISPDLAGVDVINSELEKYNLKLVDAERKVRMVVIESTK